MEFLIGLTGPGYVLLASDTLAARSIMVLSSEHNKFHTLSPHQLFASVGEPGETDRLRERLLAEANLAALRMGRSWSTTETAHFTRTLVAQALRSQTPFSVQMLIAGVDEAGLPASTPLAALQSTQAVSTLATPCARLYWMDHLAALHALPYAVHGYGAFFTWGLLDARYRADLSVDEAVHLLADVMGELADRFIVQIPKLALKLIDAEGIKDIDVKWAQVMQKRREAKSSPSAPLHYPVSWKSLAEPSSEMELSA